MTISEVKIQFVRPNDGLIGFASIVLNNSLYLGSIGVYTRLSGGYRLTFPKKDGFDVFYPINRQTCHAIEQAIYDKLNKVRQIT
ncbi:MAG: SpoVG family protein [Alphaproteobacteria bacterium]|nr:SpoVG family protein [Alphaproteobacteria bacterium]